MGQRERVLSLEHEGTVYNLRPRDFTAEDDLAIMRATGMFGLNGCFGFTGRVPELAAVAALVWRYRVGNGEDDLTYLEVLRTFTYDNIETVSDEPRDDAAPLDSAAS